MPPRDYRRPDHRFDVDEDGNIHEIAGQNGDQQAEDISEFEDFEINTKKFIKPIQDNLIDFRNKMIEEEDIYLPRIILEPEDWNSSDPNDPAWKIKRESMKGRFLCFTCQNKLILSAE